MKKLLTAALCIICVFSLFAPRVYAEFNPTPTILTTEGSTMNSIVPTSSKIYVGGWLWKYTSLANPLIATGGTLVDPNTSQGSTTFATFNDYTYAAIPDGNGGWFIGGSFTKVSGATHNELAHILADGTVDSGFNASVTGGTQIIQALALSPDGTTLYVAGGFTTVDSVSKPKLAAVSAVDGSLVSTFSPAPNGVNVFSLAISADGTKLYAVGDFTSIGGQAISKLAELNTSDGTAVAAFNPAPSAQVNQIVFAPDYSVLYVGGNFTTIGGQSRNGLAAVSTTTGAATSFNPNANTTVGVYSLVPTSDGSTLYVGGTFTNIGGQSRTRLAAINTADGTAIASFNPTASSVVRKMFLTPDESKLYIAGDFTTVNGQTRPWTASLNTSDGSITTFNPRLDQNQGRVEAVGPDGTPFVGESVFFGGETLHNDGTEFLAPGVFSTTNHDLLYMGPSVDNQILTQVLSPDGNTLYLGGWFTTIDGVSHPQIGALSASDGTVVSSFTPTTDDIVYQIMPSTDGSILYISGRFTLVDGVAHSRIAAINASDGSLVTSFTPTADDGVQAMQFSSDHSIIYIAGDFLNVDGVARNHLAAINTSDGSLVSGFNPNLTGAARALSLSPDGSTLYVAGQFTKVGATTRNRIAAVNTSDGSLVAGFDPNIAGGVVRNIILNPDGSRLYAAGQFTTVGGHAVPALASISTADGSVNTSFTQNILTAGIGLTMSADGSKLYVSQSQGQALQPTGYVPLLIFTDPSITPATKPTVTTSAASSITSTGATLNGDITATGGANPTTRGFVYGTSASYGATTTESGSFSTGAYTGAVSSLTCNTTYHFAAYATNTAGTGYGSDTTFTTSACASSGGGSGGGGSSGAILSAGAAGSSGHHFSITLPPASTSTPIVIPPTTPIVFPNTNPSASFNSGNTSSNSALALANAPGQEKKATKPSRPSSLEGSAPDPTHITLTWSPSTGADGTEAAFYRVKRDKKTLATTTDTTYTDASVTPATTYAYTVSAVDHKGNTSPESDPVVVTTPTTTPIMLIEEPTTTPPVNTENDTGSSFISGVVSFIGSSLGGAGRAIVYAGSHLAASVLELSDAMTSVLPGAAKVIPVLVPIAPPLVLLSAEVANALAGVSFSESLAAYFSRFLDFLLSLFGIRRKRNRLGLIFDSATGSPVSLAYVTLHDASTGERVSVSVSDASGAYGFFVKPGKYVMRAVKSGYAFPPREDLSLSFAGVYGNLYHGEVIEVVDDTQVVGKNMGMDRLAETKQVSRYLHKDLKRLYSILGAAVFVLGFISSAHNLWLRPGAGTVVMMLLYLAVIAYGFMHVREWGRVYGKDTKKLLPGLLVELNTPGSESRVLDRAVTDAKGRFFIHSPLGKYLLKVYQFGHPAALLVKEVTIGKDGVVNNDLAV